MLFLLENGDRTNGQKQPSQQKLYYEGGLVPIERDDWPGPPEPAAAYPELREWINFLLNHEYLYH